MYEKWKHIMVSIIMNVVITPEGFEISRNLLCSSALELHFSVELQVLILVPWFLLNGIRLRQVKLSHQLNVRKIPEMKKGKEN